MDPSLLTFLVACVVWFGLLYWVFIVRRASDLGAGGRAAIIVIGTVIVPALVLTLWLQNRSTSQLEALGLGVFHGLENSVGVATGTGEQPTWVYTLNATEADLLNFYRDPGNHVGWAVTASSDDRVELRRKSSILQIHASDGQAVFLLVDE